MALKRTVTALLAGVLLTGSLSLAMAKVDTSSRGQPSVGRGAIALEEREVPLLLAGFYSSKTCTTDEGYGRRVPCGAGP